MKNLYLIFLLFLGIHCFAQKQVLKSEPCGTDELMNTLLKNNPEIQVRIDAMNKNIREKKTSDGSKIAERFTEMDPITIPVVVYVVHDGTAAVNISDNQVQSQLTALNNAFNDYGIKFCLATKTATTTTIGMPTGAVQNIPGIIHVNNIEASSTHTMTEYSQNFLINNTVGGYPVYSDEYLRIWVVKSINGTSSGILGYGMLPGTSPLFDGVVMRYDAFGDVNNCSGCNLIPSNNQGKVLIHEVGHYLNLFHTFQGGCSGEDSITCETHGDLVCDTPQVKAPNTGCPIGNNSCGGFPDDINNYMDYTNDACRNQFTPGQIERLMETLILYRPKLFSNDNLINTGICGYQSLISASFTPNTYQPCVGGVVTFAPLVVSAPNTTYLWNFGDTASGSNNSSTSSTIVTHAFSSATNSPYSVSLTLTRNGESITYTTQIFVTSCSPIQDSESNWYLSTSNGLNFATGVPIASTSIPITNLFERSCAMQNDNSGNVMFYTNGVSVWKADHTLLNTSTPLKGSLQTFNGAFSIPIPGTTDYYIFTKSYDNLDGFRKSRVKVVGSLISMPIATINEPIGLLTGMSDFLTGNNGAVYGGSSIEAIRSCNGYWIFTTLKKSSGYFISVFSLTSVGLNYVSSIPVPTLTGIIQDQIKISPDGNKIVYRGNGYGNKICLIFDFDKFQGTLSNQKYVFNSFGNPEGIVFSPNSKFLYVSDFLNSFYQVNIDSATPLTNRIKLSSSVIPRTSKLGPDNKIYFIDSTIGNYRLGVIHNPDIQATELNLNACNFSPNGPLMGRSVNAGLATDFVLPNILPKIVSNTISAYVSGCDSYKFFPNIAQTTCYTSFKWNFGDPASGSNNISTLNIPSHSFSSVGTYMITVYSNTDVLLAQKEVTIESIVAAEIFGSISACLTGNKMTNHSVNLSEGQTVVWSIIGGGGTIIGANTQSGIDVNWSFLPGTITATVTNASGCSSIASQIITLDCDGIPNDDCVGDLLFTNTQSISADYQAGGTIVTNTDYIVSPALDIQMTAGQSITFNPNSLISAGTDFIAFIRYCVAQRPSIQEVETIIEHEKESRLDVYPNPTKGFVTISARDLKLNKVMVTSLEGKIIHTRSNINNYSYDLTLENFQMGIYSVIVETVDGEVIVDKIIKN